MSTTPHEIFRNTLQETHLWLREVLEELCWEDEAKAYLALKATLPALRDRLTVEEAAHLGAQLPMLERLRGETDAVAMLASVPGIGKVLA
jgi:uncharacterized protein (DUF2267 family)